MSMCWLHASTHAAAGSLRWRSAVPHAFEWAVLRVVPRVERGECLNAGAVVYCQGAGFLGAVVELDEPRLLALDAHADVNGVREHLEAIRALCAGEPVAGANARRAPGERFRWLTAPRSTVVQASAVHTGMTADPAAELDRLLRVMVRAPGPCLPAGRNRAETEGPAVPG